VTKRRPTAASSTIRSIADDNSETERLADLNEGVAGEFSPFEELHGFSIDGVDLRTSALPTCWRSRPSTTRSRPLFSSALLR
jgi:hypothetical protein